MSHEARSTSPEAGGVAWIAVDDAARVVAEAEAAGGGTCRNRTMPPAASRARRA